MSDIDDTRKEEISKWKRRGKFDPAGIEERKEKLALLRRYLRRPFEEFATALEITPSDPEYEELRAIWSEFHDR